MAERTDGSRDEIKRALREARERLGMTAHALDDLAGQTRGTASHYETDRKPTDRYLRKIAPFLGIPEWTTLRGTLSTNVEKVAKRIVREHVSLVPYWGVVPCGSWEMPQGGEGAELIEIPDEVEPTGVVAVRVSGDSMLPRLCHGQLVMVRLDPTPRDGVITLAQSQDSELTLKVLARSNGQWVLKSINPEYGAVTAETWRILGHAVGVSEYAPAGLRP